jgi:hypothetical protein
MVINAIVSPLLVGANGANEVKPSMRLMNEVIIIHTPDQTIPQVYSTLMLYLKRCRWSNVDQLVYARMGVLIAQPSVV